MTLAAMGHAENSLDMCELDLPEVAFNPPDIAPDQASRDGSGHSDQAGGVNSDGFSRLGFDRRQSVCPVALLVSR